LDKNYWGITPNFHIDQRIGTADRVLVIYKASQSQRRVNFSGVNTPAFAHMPSCFGLLINDLYFINISYDFLVTKRAGLPYPKSIRWREDEKIEATLPFRDGQERIQFPILDVGNDKRCTVIVQPIFNKYVQLLPHTYETNYIAALTLSSGKAKPLL
jgi:hypothetical protein